MTARGRYRSFQLLVLIGVNKTQKKTALCALSDKVTARTFIPFNKSVEWLLSYWNAYDAKTLRYQPIIALVRRRDQ